MNYRQVQRLELESALQKAGYNTVECHLPRIKLLAIYQIAINRLAAGTNVTVEAVHKQLSTAAGKMWRGTSFHPDMEKKKWGSGGQGEGKSRDAE